MDAQQRRTHIMDTIKQQKSPISASSLAKTLNVSRQVIVGDVALLRAQGHEIIATARGYMMPEYRELNQYLGKIACQHTPENTQSELYAMVDLGAIVVNVIIEHDVYGEITGSLNLAEHTDVDIFIKKVEAAEVKLLSELTMGIHLHTIACRDKTHFNQICAALDAKGYLYKM
ncbi:MAG: transcription repressor NadR [Defluviitaleaceae bacterium]|nr:transcription repressor NadR [Defluviitaleaceae bacterium]